MDELSAMTRTSPCNTPTAPTLVLASGALLIATVSACSKPDLPAGWEDAQPLKSFTQATCSGSAVDPNAPAESIDVSASSNAVRVAYHAAQFRCAQSVEGFVRKSATHLDFLVQPVDMNPSTVAGCDCLYEISMAVTASPGPTQVTVYRRWDHHGGNPPDPMQVGTASVTVP